MQNKLQQNFANLTLTRFLEEIGNREYKWFAKRLSGNDTGITGGHQVGIYLPKNVTKALFPQLLIDGARELNPCIYLDQCYFPDEDLIVEGLRTIYYNNRIVCPEGKKGTRNEIRITRWGGKSNPVQCSENTGSILLFAVKKHENTWQALAWVAKNLEEETLLEDWLGGEIEPGQFIFHPDETKPANPEESFPEEWLRNFPKSREIAEYVIGRIKHDPQRISQVLMQRRKLEYELFRIIEEKEILPRITAGFKTVDDFMTCANKLANRRKSRTGTSLETHLEAIFTAEQLKFETQAVTENRKKPDFLFPSAKDYHTPSFPEDKLHMLAAKTCCKDRWRQVISEANRIRTKHLFTLQEGISSNQIEEMQSSNIQLVIPQQNISSFPNEKRNSLMILEHFINRIKTMQT